MLQQKEIDIVIVRTLLVAAVGLASLSTAKAVVAPPSAEAQQQMTREEIRRIYGRNYTSGEIIRRLAESGLSRAEVRARLRRIGQDPYLADPYFDAMAAGSSVPGEVSEESIEALEQIGIFRSDSLAAYASSQFPRPPLDSLAGPALTVMPGDSLAGLPLDSVPETRLEEEYSDVFGSRTFSVESRNFDPLLTGPVGDDYLVGPGDELSLLIVGDVEVVHTLNVSRAGDLFIPSVGTVSAAGLTIEELRDLMLVRLGEVYSGISRNPGAETSFTLNVSGIRGIHVRVLGTVLRPGAFQLSSMATLFEALYFAGGPSDTGSYRSVLLHREGEEDPVEVDLYPYLTMGSVSSDLGLRSGDVVFVPTVGKQVTLSGRVRRRGTYELREGEGMVDLFQYGGGVLPDASTSLAQIRRILAPDERTEEIERVVVDFPLDSVLAGAADFELLPGDEVIVFPVQTEVRRIVDIRGAVRRPGIYELEPGMTVETVAERAGGLLPEAFLDRVRVLRYVPGLGRHVMYGSQVALSTEVEDRDIVEIYVREDLLWPDSVRIFGNVRTPGRYALAEGMTPGDLIISAGGFSWGAETGFVEVVRRRPDTRGSVAFSSTTVRLHQWVSEDSVLVPGPDVGPMVDDSEYRLIGDDEVYVRWDPTYRVAGYVNLQGEVVKPGSYSLLYYGERLSELIERAGGLTPQANPNGLNLTRDGVSVGVDFAAAMAGPQTTDDPVLRDQDRITVPIMDNTVAVSGAVNFPSRSVFRDGMSLKDVLALAGGTTDDADLDRISVEFANGTRRTVSKVLGLFRRYPPLEPGSTVFVPLKDPGAGFNWGDAWGATLTTTSTLITMAVLVTQLSGNDSGN